MENIVDGWNQVQGALGRIGDKIEATRLEIQAADLEVQLKFEEISIQEAQATANKIDKGISTAASCGGAVVSAYVPDPKNPTPTSSISLGISCLSGIASLSADAFLHSPKPSDLKDNYTDIKENNVAQSILRLHSASQDEFSALRAALSQVRQASIDSLQHASTLESLESDAKYQAALGSGEDFVMIDGKAIDLPVNTVLNRQYDVTAKRYKDALLDARTLAFVARRAIEQRIGLNLATVTESLGTVEAPAQWAEDVCTMKGINYENLRNRNFDPLSTGRTGGGR